MKQILIILFLLVGTFCWAIGPKTYYVSNAGNNSNNGLSMAASWQTLAQVNVAILNSGDSVFFKSGDTFYGSLSNVANGITYSSYGSGAKPIITGFVSIASWTNLGGNLYEAVVPNALQSVSMVVSNGVIIPMGRYPNANAANGGYLTYTSSNSSTPSITDSTLTGTPNWTGADIVIRKRDFVLTRNQVVSQSTTVLTLNTAGQFAFSNGYGYFFENSLQTLDQNGEWFFDSTTHKIKMYYTVTPPTIQVATIATLINLPNASSTGLTFKNLSLQGSENDLLFISYCSNIMIDGCDFFYAGGAGLENRNMSNFTIQNCNFSDNNMMAIYDVNAGLNNSNNILIRKNNFKRIGIYQGMITKNNLPNYAEGVSNTAISFGCANLMIRENIFDSVGYCGILIPKNKNNQVIRQNSISNYCFLKNDGGAIYNSGMRGDTALTVPMIIDSNIIFNSGDASYGTTFPVNPHCRGIYIDATSSNINVLNNTVYNSYEGIYLSQAQNINIKYNTLYGGGFFSPNTNKYAASLNLFDANDGYQHLRNNVITNNTFFASAPTQLFIMQTDRYNGTDSMGIIDSNMYVSPMNDYPIMLTNTTNSSIITYFSFKLWRQSHSVYDAHSTFQSTTIAPFSNTYTSVNRSPNSTFTADVNNTTALSSPTVHTFAWDNTSQITGTGSARLTSSVTSTNFTQIRQIFGATDTTKKYVVRFKTKATALGNYQVYFQQWTGAFNIMTATQQYGSIDTALQQHELLITGHSTETNAALYINFSQNTSTIYIDDIELYEATSMPNVITNYTMFNVNNSNTAVQYGLGLFTYNTLNNGSLNTVYTVPAFSSSILFKGVVYVAPVYNNPIILRYKFKRG